MVLPFMSAYERLWIGLGTVAVDLVAAVIVTSLLRDRLRPAVWRAVHWLSYASYPVTVVHSIGSSKDLRSGWLLAVTVTSPVPPSGGSIATIATAAALENSSTGAPAGSSISGATLSVTFHCLNGLAVTNSTTNGNGPTDPGSDAVTVRVSYRLNVITPFLWPVVGPSFPIVTSSSQRSEY